MEGLHSANKPIKVEEQKKVLSASIKKSTTKKGGKTDGWISIGKTVGIGNKVKRDAIRIVNSPREVDRSTYCSCTLKSSKKEIHIDLSEGGDSIISDEGNQRIDVNSHVGVLLLTAIANDINRYKYTKYYGRSRGDLIYSRFSYNIHNIKPILIRRRLMEKNIWRDGVFGVVVGDALGCPVQFMSRKEIASRSQGPVTGMEGHGTYNMPPGTWTDDSSMTLATLASIIENGTIDPEDIMKQFVKWEFDGEYSPFGEAFDEGNTCSTAIYNYKDDQDISTCGCTDEWSNGNGSLMRIIPGCLYYYEIKQQNKISNLKVIEGIHALSGLTHDHIRSKICCGFYYFMVKSIFENSTKEKKPLLEDILQDGIDEGLKLYGKDIANLTELAHVGRLADIREFKDTPVEKIRSTGYVVDTLEAAVWCLLTTDSYKDCLLKAVNLGDDTDTVGAVAGGLAGLYYGYDSIPAEWLQVIRRREWIEDLCNHVENSI